MAVPGAWQARGAEPSDSSPEPPSPSSSRPPLSDSSPSPTETTPTSRGRPPGGGARARPAPPAPPGLGGERPLALFEPRPSGPAPPCPDVTIIGPTPALPLAPPPRLTPPLTPPRPRPQEELATRPRVPALLRRIAPYSALSPDSDGGHAPSLLGLVLLLRLPWVVGHGGVLGTAAIGLLLGACMLLTAVSLSAVATNGLDPGGGALSLLSGALGPEAGGAVGVCGFLSAAFGAAAAALGGAEVLLVYLSPSWAVLPGRGRWGRLNNGRGYGAGLLALLGAGLCLPPRPGDPLRPCAPPAPPNASRGPPGQQGALPALPGPSASLLAKNLWPRPPEAGLGAGPEEGGADASFGALLGLSLPSASDLSAALLLGAGVEGQLLRDKFGVTLGGVPVLAAVAWPWPWVPVLGALLSAGGAGLQALLGGSRLLRGLARTRALPLPHALARGRLWPLVATLVTATLGVLLGSLDLLAPVLSVLCLTSYLGLNLACALQGALPTPGWSPRCPLYHWAVSLAGAVLCLSLMVVTCWHCALLALGIGATAYKYLEFRSAQTEWGEGLRGLSLSAARFALLRLEDGRPPPPSLRPQLLVLSKPGDPPVTPNVPNVPMTPPQLLVLSKPGDPPAAPPRPELMVLAAQLQGGGRGLTVLGAVLGGALPGDLPRARGAERALRAALAQAGARGFVQVLVTPEAGPGLAALVQGVGLGALRPNTVLLGWPRRWRQQPDPARAARDFVELLRVAGAGGRALLVSKGAAEPGAAPGGSLDVWWVVGTGRLLTLLPLLLRQHPAWRGCPLRLFTVALLEDNSERLRRLLEAVARRRALPAQVHVVELHNEDVSAYTYERTLMMEQRSQMLRQLRRAQGGPAPSQPPSAEEEEGGEGEPRRGPSPGNVRRMHAAERLNAAIGAHSAGAGLVLLDLPPPPGPRPHGPLENYLEFLEVLTEGLGPVLLVRGGDGDQCDQYGPGNGTGDTGEP
ncbi:solute carrier family 12 member 4-like [Sylvia borin]